MWLHNITEIWKFNKFRDLFLSGFLTSIARWLELLVFSVIVWKIYNNSVFVGILVTLRLVSMMITGFIFIGKGTLFSGRNIMITFTFCCFFSCLLISSLMFFKIEDGLIGICLISIFSGCLWSVDFSFRRRMLADTLPTQLVSSGVSVDVLSTHATRLIGPFLGGICLTFFLNEYIILILALLYLLSLIFLLPHNDKHFIKDNTSFQNMLNIVFKEALKNKNILLVLFLTPLFNIFALPYLALIGILSIEKFNKNNFDIGLITSLEGLGALIGGIIISMFPPYRKSLFFSLMLLIILISMTLSAISKNYFAFIILIIIFGASTASYSALQSTIIYNYSPPKLRSSLYSLMTIAIGSGFIGAINVSIMSSLNNTSRIVLIMGAEGIILLMLFLAIFKIKKTH